MGTTLHSFKDIFETEFNIESEPVLLKKIAIPLIQRDYAQGRMDDDVNRVRSRFLASLYHAVVDKPITLDFVYGDIDSKGTMTPLDGQQRLTTLFLLHWYAAKKEAVPSEQYAFLNCFSYETRYSARYFCAELINHQPSFQEKISDEIINQSWFPFEWKKDPTISSMLVMLDAIDDQFKNVDNIWDNLMNNAITFYFLPIKDMGLTDELYIKMNSRGKPLTMFEHFKAELEHEMRILEEKETIEKGTADRIIYKIDRTWTDLLWTYRNSDTGSSDDNIIDDEFLRYFKFICDILCYKNGQSPQNYSSDEFALLQRYFSSESQNSNLNLRTLEAFFDCWCNIDGYNNPAEFLMSFMSASHAKGKIIVEKNNIDIFEDCLHSYSDKSGRIRQFPLNRIVLLYAITVYLQNQKTVSYDEFTRRIRIVNNLIQNSEDEVSDRADRNRIPAILREVDAIILTGIIDDEIENNFNVNQLTEEKEKIAYLLSHPEDAQTVFELEDHPMLRGQISIIGLNNLSYASRFHSLFSGACKWDKIDCALMAIGNYGQRERNNWRYQFASNGMWYAWNELFHKSANAGFEQTRDILIQLLKTNEEFTNKELDTISGAFLSECKTKHEYPWRYYYVKYSEFRPGSFGKLSNNKAAENPYLFSVLQTKTQWSQNTYMPYLKAADNDNLSRDYMGQLLLYGDKYIACENSAYILCNFADDTILERIEICQNEAGVDTEDRIKKLIRYIKSKKMKS